MEDERTRRTKLDQSRKPIAIVHEGVFVYANPAFLKRLGYNHFEELEAITALDLVEPAYQERFRSHLKRAESIPHSVPNLPSDKLSMLKEDGSRFLAISSSHHTVFDGENCVLFSIRTKEDKSLKNTLLNLPWKLYLSILFLIVFYLLPPALLLKLNINNAPKTYTPSDAPAIVIDDELRELFPNDQVLILLFEGVALFSDGFIEAIDQLTVDLKSRPEVDDVISITTQDHIAGSNEGFFVEPLVDPKELEKRQPRQRLQHVVSDRFAKNRLVAADGSAIAMVVIPALDENSMQRVQFQKIVLSSVDDARLSGYLSAVSGQIAVDVAQFHSMLQDNMLFIPATVIIGLTFIWWLFRRWLAVLVAGVATGVVTSSTVAFYVLFDKPFTLISSIIPPLLSALTTATLIHLFNALHYASQRGLVGRARVDKALEEIRRPALFTTLTTAVGLASLAASPIPPIKDFGMVAAAGVVLIYVVVIVVVPNIFARWDYVPWPNRVGGLRWMDRIVRKLLQVGIRYPVWVITVIVTLIAAGVPQIWNVEAESNLQEFFMEDHPVRQATNRVEEKLTGTTSLDIIFKSASRDALKKPENLKIVRDFQNWAEALPEVDLSVSYADFVEEMHWAFNAETPEYRVIPEREDLISQYLFVYDGADIYDFIDRDFKTSRVNLNINVHGANEIGRVMDKIRHYLNEQVGNRLEWDIAGFGRIFADQAKLLVKGQVYSLWSAVGLIFLLMLILWRSVWSAVLCMIPNLSPILLIFIIMGTAGISLDMATVMIASVAVGIAVDDTIHVYHGFKQRIDRGTAPVTALARAFGQAGRAVVTTTIILCAQFMILMTSQFVPTTHFGMLASVGLWAALVFDLLLMPAMLILIYGRRT
ncbi:MAG: efflux RND transporter permease subunit [Candidatus Polarisedimenticolaceae bacterium]|nr:efflux RND transporter permease subunit [Candidatus Polarisedimenticolaceae bacterium]